jgi:hypothetical protein
MAAAPVDYNCEQVASSAELNCLAGSFECDLAVGFERVLEQVVKNDLVAESKGEVQSAGVERGAVENEVWLFFLELVFGGELTNQPALHAQDIPYTDCAVGTRAGQEERRVQAALQRVYRAVVAPLVDEVELKRLLVQGQLHSGDVIAL